MDYSRRCLQRDGWIHRRDWRWRCDRSDGGGLRNRVSASWRRKRGPTISWRYKNWESSFDKRFHRWEIRADHQRQRWDLYTKNDIFKKGEQEDQGPSGLGYNMCRWQTQRRKSIVLLLQNCKGLPNKATDTRVMYIPKNAKDPFNSQHSLTIVFETAHHCNCNCKESYVMFQLHSF